MQSGGRFFRRGLLLVAAAFVFVACGAVQDGGMQSTASRGEAQSTVKPPSGSSVAQPTSSAPLVPQATLHEGASPLTGKKLAEDAPLQRRPLAVMVDNVRAALPQRGLMQADIVYEMVTESGITRLMAVYADYTKMPEVGPVRSARDQHVQLAFPLDALYLHVGGSTYANEMLSLYHYEDKSINGRNAPGALELDADRNALSAIEHCWFTNGALFTQAAETYKLDTALPAVRPAFQFVPYDAPPRVLTGGDALGVEVRFSGYTTCTLVYNAETRRYEKSQFGAPQMDENTGQQLAFDNVLVLFTDVTKYPDGVLANVRYAFGGVGVYCSGGRYEKVRWMKGAPEEPLRIVSTDGTETPVALNPGTTYVAIADLGVYPHFRISAVTPSAAKPQREEAVDETEAQEAPDV